MGAAATRFSYQFRFLSLNQTEQNTRAINARACYTVPAGGAGRALAEKWKLRTENYPRVRHPRRLYRRRAFFSS